MNQPIVVLIIAILPSVVVFLTSFFTLKHFLASQRADQEAIATRDSRKQTLPLRLQAYERLVLFLERISPGALVLRVHKSNMTARMFHAQLTATIREEYEHNVAQQIYVSEKAWSNLRQAKEETIRLINVAYERTRENAPGTELSQRIFEAASQLSHLPTQAVIISMKEEVRRLF